MARTKKKASYNDICAGFSTGDIYGTIFDGMLSHENFIKLNNSLKLFYVYCRVQSQTKRCKSWLIEYGKQNGEQYELGKYFVFPAAHLRIYGIDRCHASQYMQALINAGYVERIEQNKARRKANVYRFSERWKDIL